MTVAKTETLQRSGSSIWIELGNGFLGEDDQWYVCIGHNGRQPRAPMSKAEAYAAFHRIRDELIADGWRPKATGRMTCR
jgi:hypothetical protein